MPAFAPDPEPDPILDPLDEPEDVLEVAPALLELPLELALLELDIPPLGIFSTAAPLGASACQTPPNPWPLTWPALVSPENR